MASVSRILSIINASYAVNVNILDSRELSHKLWVSGGSPTDTLQMLLVMEKIIKVDSNGVYSWKGKPVSKCSDWMPMTRVAHVWLSSASVVSGGGAFCTAGTGKKAWRSYARGGPLFDVRDVVLPRK